MKFFKNPFTSQPKGAFKWPEALTVSTVVNNRTTPNEEMLRRLIDSMTSAKARQFSNVIAGFEPIDEAPTGTIKILKRFAEFGIYPMEDRGANPEKS